MKRFFISVLPFVLVVLGLAPARAAEPVALIQIDGVISPVTLRLVSMAIDRAQAEKAQALIIQLDTPGGLERSMRAIVQRELNAEVPVIVFVGPTGARAASAGVFITMAAHVAAMAPATNIGAAHPVAVGGGQMDKESAKKIENDAAAFARTIATERGRNAEWAEKAVRASVSATEREAVKLKVVDLIAENVADLLVKIDGRTVKTVKGPVTLRTADAPIKKVEIGFRDRFLMIITDPNIAYILMMIGMLGLFFELSNPGVILPGVLGGISLIRAFWWVILPTVGTTAGFFAFAVTAGVRALFQKPTTGSSGLIGTVGVARSALDPTGEVFIHGERWRAVAEGGGVAEGEAGKGTGINGLTVKVIKATGS